jgi:lipopolysaccharide biosynthesis glycosyltransferase
MRMPIAYAINDIYTKPLMAQLIPLFEQADAQTIYDIYILNHGLSNDNRSSLRSLVASLKSEATLTFLDISNEDNAKIPLIGVWGREASYRGLLAQLLPDVERILYLDADTMVLGDLTHLMELDLTDKPYAASADIAPQYNNILGIACADNNLEAEELLMTFGYINSGVMLINLAYWREHNWGTEFVRLLSLMKDAWPPLFPDQDVLNYLAIRDGVNRIYYLPTTYNTLYAHHVASMEHNRVETGKVTQIGDLWWHAQVAKRNQWLGDADSKLVFNKVMIIHFCSLKPWHHGRSSDAYVELFKPYAERVGLELPPLVAKKTPLNKFLQRNGIRSLGELKVKMSKYKKVIKVGVVLDILLIFLLSFVISRFL